MPRKPLKHHARNQFLSGTYTLGNGALYLATCLRIPQLLGISDKKIGEEHTPADNFYLSLLLIVSFMLALSNWYSYVQTVDKYFSEKKSKYEGKKSKLLKRFFQANGLAGSALKTAASSASLFDLMSSVIDSDSKSGLAIIIAIVAICGIGYFFCQASILCGMHPEAKRERDDETAALLRDSTRLRRSGRNNDLG